MIAFKPFTRLTGLLVGLIALATLGLTPALADTTPTQVTCTPANGGVDAGSTVSCGISLGTGATFIFWTSSGFSPTFSHNLADTFTAVTPGMGTITATYQD